MKKLSNVKMMKTIHINITVIYMYLFIFQESSGDQNNETDTKGNAHLLFPIHLYTLSLKTCYCLSTCLTNGQAVVV